MKMTVGAVPLDALINLSEITIYCPILYTVGATAGRHVEYLS